MSESGEKKGFWARLFSSNRQSAREEKLLEYVVHRLNEGANLHDVMDEEYVKRNATRSQIEEIVNNPRIVEAAREKMQEELGSEAFDPNRRPDRRER